MTYSSEIFNVSKTFKGRNLYAQVRQNRQVIDLIGDRLGACLNKNSNEIRLYMDESMFGATACTEKPPGQLFADFVDLVRYDLDKNTFIVPVSFEFSEVKKSLQHQYQYVVIEVIPENKILGIIDAVLKGDVLCHIDNAIEELDLRDGVFRLDPNSSSIQGNPRLRYKWRPLGYNSIFRPDDQPAVSC